MFSSTPCRKGYGHIPDYIAEREDYLSSYGDVIRTLSSLAGRGHEITATREEILAAGFGTFGLSTLSKALHWLTAHGDIETIPDRTLIARRRIHFLWRRTHSGVVRITPTVASPELTHQSLARTGRAHGPAATGPWARGDGPMRAPGGPPPCIEERAQRSGERDGKRRNTRPVSGAFPECERGRGVIGTGRDGSAFGPGTRTISPACPLGRGDRRPGATRPGAAARTRRSPGCSWPASSKTSERTRCSPTRRRRNGWPAGGPPGGIRAKLAGRPGSGSTPTRPSTAARRPRRPRDRPRPRNRPQRRLRPPRGHPGRTFRPSSGTGATRSTSSRTSPGHSGPRPPPERRAPRPGWRRDSRAAGGTRSPRRPTSWPPPSRSCRRPTWWT